MGVRNRAAHIQIQTQYGCYPEILFAAVNIDRAPLDAFHDDVWRAVLRRAAIEQARDIGMAEPRQSLALTLEAGEEKVRIHAAADQLDRDFSVILPIGALAEVDDAHTASPQFARQCIRSGPADKSRGFGCLEGEHTRGELLLHKCVSLRVAIQ
jgi:hypothetical protein